MNKRKFIGRCIFWGMISPGVILIILMALLYLPAVQQWAVGKATEYASTASGLDIRVGRIGLAFPFRLSLSKVCVCSPEHNDTLAHIEQMHAGIELWPLWEGQINVTMVELREVTAHTHEFLPTTAIEGSIGHLRVESGNIGMIDERVEISTLLLADTDVRVTLKEEEHPHDTLSQPLRWELLLHKACLSNVALMLKLPADTTTITTGWKEVMLSDFSAHLDQAAYQLLHGDISGGYVQYDRGISPKHEGFDPQHVDAREVVLEADSLCFHPTKVAARVKNMAFQEQSGFVLNHLSGRFVMNEIGVSCQDLDIMTPHSHITIDGNLDEQLFSHNHDGELSALVQGRIGVKDVQHLYPKLFSQDIFQHFTDKPLALNLNLHGSTDSLLTTHIDIQIDHIIHLQADGRITDLLDASRRNAHMQLTIDGEDLNFVTSSGMKENGALWKIPHNLKGEAKLNGEGTRWECNMMISEQTGWASVHGHFDEETEEYALQVKVDSLPLHEILAQDSLRHLSAHANVQGRGLDIYAGNTHLTADAEIDMLEYKEWDLSAISLHASLQDNKAHITVGSDLPFLKMQTDIEASLQPEIFQADASINIPLVNLHQLGWISEPMQASLCAHFSGASNYRDDYSLKGELTHIDLKVSERKFQPKELYFILQSSVDSLYTQVEAGDLAMMISADKSLPGIMNHMNSWWHALSENLKEKDLSLEAMKEYLPECELIVRSGADNPICNLVQHVGGVDIGEMEMQFLTSPRNGLKGNIQFCHLSTDSLLIDTLYLDIHQDTAAIQYAAAVVCRDQSPATTVFQTLVDGYVSDNGGETLLSFYNANKQKKVLELGLRATVDNESWRLHVIPENPILGYRHFSLNEDNYICLPDSGKISANVFMKDDGGAGLHFYSIENAEAQQDLTINVSHLDLAWIKELWPYAPQIAGLLDVEMHYVQDVSGPIFTATMQVTDAGYENYPMGTWGMEAAYLPTSKGEHVANLQVMNEEQVVASIDGIYTTQSDEGEKIDAHAVLDKFPLSPANASLTRELVMMKNGWLSGRLKVTGNPSVPRINGEISIDSVAMYSSLYALDLSFVNNRVEVKENRINFDDFKIYARGNNPFILSGKVDMGDFSHVNTDLRMHANDYELLNARESQSSLLHGRVIVSLYSTIQGELTQPRIRGNMQVSGGTDVTYVLKESPLVVEDRLGSMVTFVNLDDTVGQNNKVKKEMSLGGLDLMWGVEIDQGAQVKVDLGDGSYAQAQGGGNLTMRYTPQGDFTLTGRYTLEEGEMKYSLPVIPLKTFQIARGSYVEFKGDAFNPTLHIQATEQVRASVTEDDKSRYVNFDVGVNLTNTLHNMGLEFTMNAPEDVGIQNQLAAMTAEERGKLAVAMLVTGMYAGGQGSTSGGIHAAGALNTFLQSEIANIAGSALKSVDVSIGVEENYAADGSAHGSTDYSFKFAKRFWNNRLSVVVGGRIRTGESEETSGGNTFIDDISLEWRLDDSGTRYIKLFHTKNDENIFDGEVTRTGVGLVVRKKVNRLDELFVFRKRKNKNSRN